MVKSTLATSNVDGSLKSDNLLMKGVSNKMGLTIEQAWLAVDWDIRVRSVVWLKAINVETADIESLPTIHDEVSLENAIPVLEQADRRALEILGTPFWTAKHFESWVESKKRRISYIANDVVRLSSKVSNQQEAWSKVMGQIGSGRAWRLTGDLVGRPSWMLARDASWEACNGSFDLCSALASRAAKEALTGPLGEVMACARTLRDRVRMCR